jgi:5-methylcytosine-specific restriction protein A
VSSPRKSAAERGYGARWRLARAAFLSHPENALCVLCKRRGHLAAARVVDHIIPHRGDLRLFWNSSNWQPLCFACHNEKAGKEGVNYRTGKPVIAKGCDESGLPLDPNHPWRART